MYINFLKSQKYKSTTNIKITHSYIKKFYDNLWFDDIRYENQLNMRRLFYPYNTFIFNRYIRMI